MGIVLRRLSNQLWKTGKKRLLINNLEKLIMKKITYLFLAASILAAVSCAKPEVPAVQPDVNEPAEQTLLNPVTLTFTADPSTKVAIDAEGHASWEEGDKIQIVSFDAEGKAKYVKDIEVKIVEGVGTFKATVEDSDIYYAVYPSAAEVTLVNEDGVDKLKVTIASKQDGSFKNACYYAAKTTKEAKQFNFKAISGIIKFQADPSYKKVDIRDVEKTSSRHALAQAETCTFDAEGNVTVAPVANISSMISIALDGNGNGTYYAAVCGNATNEVAFRFSKDAEDTPEESKLGFEPGVYYNNLITFEPARIKNFGILTDKIVNDVYVAPEAKGTGDGRSAENAAPASDLVEACLGNDQVKYTAVKGLLKYTGVWNCFRMDGLTIHFADGEYTDKFTVAGNNSSFVVTLDGSAGAIQKGGITVSATREGTVTKINGMTFTAETGLTVSNGNCEVTGCTFKGCTTRAAAIGGTAATDATLNVNFKNCLFSANTCASAGVVNVPNGSGGGILGFNNCRFENNTATSGNASAIYTASGKTAIFLNKCTFRDNKCTSTSNAYTIGMNDAATRFAMNCCTVNAGTPGAYNNGAAITLKGQSIISNSTVWTSKEFGKWGLVALGCATSTEKKNGALIINSVVRQNGTTYPAVYLHTNYYQNLKDCLHQGADLTVVGDKHTVENTVKVSAFNSASAKEATVDGIKAYYYTWDYSNTIGESGFVKPSATAVRNAIAAVGESATGEKDGLGGLFLKWLDSVDENAFSKDITGKARPAEGLCPGSYQN